MTATHGDDLTATYLDRLRAGVADLPESERTGLLERVTAHLAATVPPGSGDGAVRNALDELGPPGRLAASARADHVARPRGRSGAAVRAGGRTSASDYDIVTVILVLFGGFVAPVVGWLAGAVMLWAGSSWSTGDRLLGTFVAPVLAAVAVVAFPFVEAAVGDQFAAVAGIVVVGLILLGAAFSRLLNTGRARTA